MLRRLVRASGRPLSVSLRTAPRRPGRLARAARQDRGRPRPRACRSVAPGRAAPDRPAAGPARRRSIRSSRMTAYPGDRSASRLAEKVAAMRDPAFRARSARGSSAANRIRVARNAFDGVRPDVPARRTARIRAAGGNIGRRHGRRARTARPPISPTTCCWRTRAETSCSRRSPITPHYNLDALRRDDRASQQRDGPGRRRRACRHHLRRAAIATYLLTHWGRDRATADSTLPYLVKRQTADTARAVGLTGSRHHRAGHESRYQRHRFRPAGRATAGDGVRSSGRRQAAAAKGRGVLATIVSGRNISRRRSDRRVAGAPG